MKCIICSLLAAGMILLSQTACSTAPHGSGLYRCHSTRSPISFQLVAKSKEQAESIVNAVLVNNFGLLPDAVCAREDR